MTAYTEIKTKGCTEVVGQMIGLDEFYEDFFSSEAYNLWYRRLIIIQEQDPLAEPKHRAAFQPMMDAEFQKWCSELDRREADYADECREELRDELSKRFPL